MKTVSNAIVNDLYSQIQSLEGPSVPASASYQSVGKRPYVQIPQLSPQQPQPSEAVSQPPAEKKRRDNHRDCMIQPSDLLAAEVMVEHEAGGSQSFEEFIQNYLNESSKTYLSLRDSMISCTPSGQMLNPVSTTVPISSREVILLTITPSVRFLLAIRETHIVFSSRAFVDHYFREALMKVRNRLINMGLASNGGDEYLNKLVADLLNRCNIVAYPYV